MAGHSRPKDGVASARLCPAIHVFARCMAVKTWMPGTSPAMMTKESLARAIYRSSVNTGDFDREQQTIILLFSAFSSSLRKESR